MQSKFRAEGPQILRVAVQNVFATVICAPLFNDNYWKE